MKNEYFKKKWIVQVKDSLWGSSEISHGYIIVFQNFGLQVEFNTQICFCGQLNKIFLHDYFL
jgi:hypothetical protein